MISDQQINIMNIVNIPKYDEILLIQFCDRSLCWRTVSPHSSSSYSPQGGALYLNTFRKQPGSLLKASQIYDPRVLIFCYSLTLAGLFWDGSQFGLKTLIYPYFF